MKRLTLMLLVLLVVTLPAFGQDEEDSCSADFADSIAALEALQADYAATANTDQLVAGLQDVIADLEIIRQGCMGALPLTQEFDDFGFRMAYPDGWVYEMDAGGVIIFGTSQDAIDAYDTVDPVFRPGEFGMFVFLDVEQALGLMLTEDDPLQQIVGELTDVLTTDAGYTVSEPVSLSINDRRAIRVDFAGDFIAGEMIAVAMGDERYLLFAPAAAVGELADFEATYMAMIESAGND